MHKLVPFAKEDLGLFQVYADLSEQGDHLLLQYKVLGPIDKILIPAPAKEARFHDLLWQSTCFEVFLQEGSQTAYEEWNFSPSGDWANFRFSEYRQRTMENIPSHPPQDLKFSHDEHQIILEAKIPKKESGAHTHAPNFRYGLTAILHLHSGMKQYWAMTHLSDQANFHLAASFLGKSRGQLVRS